MRLLDKYLIYSSIFALFTEDFSFHYGIDLKLFYVIVLLNFAILSFTRKITIHKNLIIILGFFIIHGVVLYLWKHNHIKSLVAQIIGISISSIYYYNFLKKYGSSKLFKVYSQFAFYIALLAIPMFYLGINPFSKYRLNGILSEPAHYAAIMLPATYYFFREKKYLRLILIVLTIFLSRSSIGFVGLALILVVPLLKTKFFIKYSWAVLILLLLGGVYLKMEWNKPIDENKGNQLVRRLKETNKSLNAVATGKFEKYTNLSSYAFLSNSFITKQIVSHNPLGTGLGSYHHEYDKYYNLLTPPDYLIQLKQSKINRTDANSLFLRMTADFGLFSLLFFGYFIYRLIRVFSNENKIKEQSVSFYLLVKLIREGHYFPPEFYFFLLIFLKDFDEDTAHS
ncbi:O-Antigen ligase [Tenacibaculum sp. 190524A05c]|uniref:O-antigen ligase family protein n=1 Tax=Tenacibaculum platacis TaxID=3137852 RepID=UPI0031FB79DC